MEYVEINKVSYRFARNFKHDQKLRASFNKLTETSFGFNLENWYQKGFWTDYYIPYSLLHNNEVVSNVSVNVMDLNIKNDRVSAVQIGTVMSAEKYQHKGLNKFIMAQVINEWKNQTDFIYLFANDSVLDFYPKFNFQIINEYQYSKSLNNHNTPSSLKKLNVDDRKDASLLLGTVSTSIPLSKVSLRNNVPLLMFYCLSFKKNSIFYIEKLKAIVIADFKGHTLYINDVFSGETVDLHELIGLLADKNTRNVVLGFTPLDGTGYDKRLIREGDTLFILKSQSHPFKNNRWMFPVLSHA